MQALESIALSHCKKAAVALQSSIAGLKVIVAAFFEIWPLGMICDRKSINSGGSMGDLCLPLRPPMHNMSCFSASVQNKMSEYSRTEVLLSLVGSSTYTIMSCGFSAIYVLRREIRLTSSIPTFGACEHKQHQHGSSWLAQASQH